jgi:AcrR family transcriptional regulator
MSRVNLPGMQPVDRVRTRPGGRNAQARERVINAVRQALEAGDIEGLSVEALARASGVHKATIYRRWLSTAGVIAELLNALTPVRTPLPDTGDLQEDLTEVANRVAATIAAPMSRVMLPIVAGTTDLRLAEAATRYWTSLFDHTAGIVRNAQHRGQATTHVDPRDAIESLLAPIYLRTLVTHEPVTAELLDQLVERTARMLQP